MTLGASTSELDYMLADAGTLATFGTVRAYGLFDRESMLGTDASGFAADLRRTTFRIRQGAFSGIEVEDRIRIEGTSYVVREIDKAGSDGLQTLELVEV